MTRHTTFGSLALMVALAAATAPVVAQSVAPPPQPQRGGVPEQAAERTSVRESQLRRMQRTQGEGRPVIGVVLAPGEGTGVELMGITPGSAAAEAGLRTGDRLVAIDGHALLGSTGELRAMNARRLLSDLDSDRPVRIAYERDGKRRDVSLVPRETDRVIVWVDDDGREVTTHGDVVVMTAGGLRSAQGVSTTPGAVPGLAPRIRAEVGRLRPGSPAPRLLEAFRWNGLNLATVGKELGRYFGATEGVLVLTAGPGLEALQPGDVIRKVGDAKVRTPREAMAVLRKRTPGSKVAIDVLRDRKPVRAVVTVPVALPAVPTAPPPPPAPPAPPAPPRPPAPPSPIAAN